MRHFHHSLPAWGAIALACIAAAGAYAQQAPAFTCIGNAGVPPLVRAEGLTEFVGDLVLNCKGGSPTAAGSPVPQANVQIFLNTNITSRLTSDPWSEALLLIDEPGPAAQRYCGLSGGCPNTGVGAATGFDGLADGIDYDEPTGIGSPNPPNIYQAQKAGVNSLVWLGVPIDPPGANATRILRITNVRANANQLGVASTLIPTQIVMFVSVTGTTSVPINNPQQTVAYIIPGLSFSASGPSYLQCNAVNSAAATDNSKTLSDGLGASVSFTEGFASAFKRRNAAPYIDADTSPAPINQNVPGASYNTETGFYNGSPNVVAGSANGLSIAGLADHGTRLIARFSNVPSGVTLYAAVYPYGGSALNQARLITAADGPFSRAIPTNDAPFVGPTAPIVLNSNGTGTAVWEVLDADPRAIQTFTFGIGIAYASNTANNLPGLGSATIAGSFAPLSTVTTQSSSAPVPRFTDTSSAQTFFTINACTTNLLFVFLSNQAGFDTGIVISNTSVDPFGHGGQNGPCTLNYYGETPSGGAAPAAQTSAVIPGGKQLTAVLSTGGNYGIKATPGFQGYLIAQCGFQYAHGFAFISDVGANRVSEAYQALVLDSLLPARTPFASEILGH